MASNTNPTLEEQLRVARELQADRTPVRDARPRRGFSRGRGTGVTRGGVSSGGGHAGGGHAGSFVSHHGGSAGLLPLPVVGNRAATTPSRERSSMTASTGRDGLSTSIWATPASRSFGSLQPSGITPSTRGQEMPVDGPPPRQQLSSAGAAPTAVGPDSPAGLTDDEDLMDLDAPFMTYQPPVTENSLAAETPSLTRSGANAFSAPPAQPVKKESESPKKSAGLNSSRWA